MAASARLTKEFAVVLDTNKITMPGITMVGTMSTFNSVLPLQKVCYNPSASCSITHRLARRYSEGMRSLDFQGFLYSLTGTSYLRRTIISIVLNAEVGQ